MKTIQRIKHEIMSEINKDTYGHDTITDQGIRTGYLSALAIIEKVIADSNKEETK